MPFVKCTFLWVPFWYPLAKIFFFHILWWKYLHVKRPIFLQKIKQKCLLNKVSASFVWAPRPRKKKKTWGHKKASLSWNVEYCQLFLLSLWDLCLILIGGEQRLSLSGGLEPHGLMLCHWQEQHRRPKRCHFSSCQLCHFVCHFGRSFCDSWTLACDDRSSESVRLKITLPGTERQAYKNTLLK